MFNYNYLSLLSQLTEPIGTTLPTFSTAMIGLVSIKEDDIISLTCPAQAFPAPSSRYETTDPYLFTICSE